jgi:hypothetical protein
MTQNDWDVNPDSYVKDDDGNFVLKKDGTPRKKAGRSKGSGGRGYNYHSKTKAKINASKKIREKKKKIAQARSSIARHQESLKKTEKALDILEDKSKNRIVEETFVEEAAPSLQPELKENIIFQPNEGPQMDFLAAAETDVLYGGAAGGGKSYAMLVDPLRFAHRAAHRALILRRSMPELRELIDKSRELYPKAFPGCKYREVEKLWTFPSGAKVEFGFLERDADVYRYQGQAYSWIGFDEITHLPTEFSWNYLASRLRTTD